MSIKRVGIIGPGTVKSMDAVKLFVMASMFAGPNASIVPGLRDVPEVKEQNSFDIVAIKYAQEKRKRKALKRLKGEEDEH